MAFSMFLRSSACRSPVFNQQMMRFATQPILKERSIVSTLPIKSLTLTQAKSTPILNSVRSFRTSLVRLSQEKAHDHSKLWVVEKLTSVLLVPLVPLGLLMPNKLFDSVLAILITAHSFWGLEAIVLEYLRVLVVGPVVPKIAMGMVYLITAVTMGGLFYLIFNDIGMCRAFWRIWRNMKKPKDNPPPSSGLAVMPPIQGPGSDRC
ncbi:succinate dehydrogenase [ubiquinone] cytochrome b small subunit, mitochondrial isoform X1 [Achroia grisella]|uniref:succinate dehydrogenase [ubiquinone] cytochrome b small subunit, mitochondrial isoform X1 n=1 Tax=Achroia grisella TaxID=688607 RepID=UPI0027D23EB2|nr:succinate dehydrogenase [ubiquinone] cytochrome b small subunit, mitochondrial isoform X1 [Achroia grisella]